MTNPSTRSFETIHDYAQRLAAIPKTETEQIPVSLDEAFVVQEAVARQKGFAGTMSVFDMELCNRRLKIL
jgi:hypothetical protein